MRSKKFMFSHQMILSLSVLCVLTILPLYGQSDAKKFPVSVRETLLRLIEEEDTDGDKKITIEDEHVAGTNRGDKKFWLRTAGGRYEVAGTYYVSNLLQELKLAEESGLDSTVLLPEKIFEAPADRISRMIKEYFWDGLTRRIDEQGLIEILNDDKTNTFDGFRYIYIPERDALAFQYYNSIVQTHPDLRAKVVKLPREITPAFVRQLDGKHGLLSLSLSQTKKGNVVGTPFVVPGGRFNEMYGWDSYFITLGLIEDGKIDEAKAMVDNFTYEIEQYGKILNANRTYYLTRSQPPFFTSMISEVYSRLPRNTETKKWLVRTLNAAIKEYRTVWMSQERRTVIGLNRYFDSGYGQPPEVEEGHFNTVYAAFAKQYDMDQKAFEQAYRAGSLKVPALDDYFVHDRAMRESGHDTSYRLDGHCADLATVDLNSLLYKIECDIETILQKEFDGSLTTADGKRERSADWGKKAAVRKELIHKYLWNEQAGMFFDYDVVKKKQTGFVSATAFFPLWAHAATEKEAKLLIKKILPLLEMPGGVAGSTEESRGEISDERPPRQWDFPNGWAPHQMLVWQGLQQYGYTDIAQRLAYRWLYTITSNAVRYNGTVPEKFDVVTRSHQVFAEYGNVGTKFSYITREGFGWTNASYQIGLTLLTKEMKAKLNNLIPPEWIFD